MQDTFDPKLVRKLADILNDTGLTEIEIGRGDLKIRVARMAQASVMPPAPIPQVVLPAAPMAPNLVPAEANSQTGLTVRSPMVGTVYHQPQPGAAAFIKIGDIVSEGQTLLIIEAMKTMNPVPAPKAGKVVDILVGDGQPIEFGEPLVVLG